MADEDAEVEIKRALDVLQSMIDVSAEALEGLRTQCATSAELTQQEIRTLEVKYSITYDRFYDSLDFWQLTLHTTISWCSFLSFFFLFLVFKVG